MAFGKLVALGCPATCQPTYAPEPSSPRSKASAEFREQAMHGSTERAREIAPHCDVHQREATSGRTALHKAAFWGHVEMVKYLTQECKLDPNVQDNYGDTALHDVRHISVFFGVPFIIFPLQAAKFGHAGVGINQELRVSFFVSAQHPHVQHLQCAC